MLRTLLIVWPTPLTTTFKSGTSPRLMSDLIVDISSRHSLGVLAHTRDGTSTGASYVVLRSMSRMVRRDTALGMDLRKKVPRRALNILSCRFRSASTVWYKRAFSVSPIPGIRRHCDRKLRVHVLQGRGGVFMLHNGCDLVKSGVKFLVGYRKRSKSSKTKISICLKRVVAFCGIT